MFWRLGLALVLATACGDNTRSGGVSVKFELAGGFFDAPFPIASRARTDGSIRVDDYPTGSTDNLVPRYVAAVDQFNEGFGRNTAMWFPLTGAIDETTLPTAPTPGLSDSVFVLNIDPDSASFGQPAPIEIQFKAAAETHSPENLLVLLPVQGRPLEPSTAYAAFVTGEVRSLDGRPLVRGDATSRLLERRGGVDSEIEALLEPALDLLDRAERRRDIIGLTAFRTGDASARVHALAEVARAMPAPVARNLTQIRSHDGFRVFEGEVDLPMFQTGQRPYVEPGDGTIEFVDGVPQVAETETVRFSLSVPDAAPGAAGYPLLLYAPGQGGSYLQAVDRGADETLEDGDGPALYLAERGIATLGIEANLTGPRHPGGSTTGLSFFNVENLVALLDNHRQAVSEYGTLLRLAETLSVPPIGGGPALSFDADNVFIHGHSTGSVITAVALAVHPELRAGLLTGAGGSWLYNLVRKQSPPISDFVRVLLGLKVDDDPDEFDPLINLVAMLLEPVEPMNYAAHWARDMTARTEPASVLLIGGIIDTFYLPEMIAALAVSARMDLVGPILDEDLVSSLESVGRGVASAPVSGNSDGATLVVSEYVESPGSDGHYVVFEQEEPKHQYSCFFASAVGGAGSVAVGRDSGLAPCD